MTNPSLNRTRAADDRIGGARSIGLLNGARSFRGSVGVRDKFDYYSFSVASRSSFNLGLDKLKNNVDVALIQNGQTLARSARGGKKPESINTTLEAGTYFIRVSQKNGDSRYRLKLNAEAIAPPPVPTPPPLPPQASRRFLGLFSSSPGTPTLGSVDLSNGNFSPLPSSTRNFSDIAAFGNDLFGITLFDSFYKIDNNTGVATFVGSMNSFGMNALEFAPSGTLYGANGSSLLTIDKATGKATKIADIPGFISAGDLAYDPASQRFLATSIDVSSGATGNTLYSIGLAGDARLVGNIGFNNVFGLFVDNGTLYGYTADRQQIVINPTTGAGTFNKTVTGTEGLIGGAT
jgi:hypothetical protein